MGKIVFLQFEDVIVKEPYDNLRVFEEMISIYSEYKKEKFDKKKFIEEITVIDPKITRTLFDKATYSKTVNPDQNSEIIQIIRSLKGIHDFFLITDLKEGFVEKYLERNNLRDLFKKIYSTRNKPVTKKSDILHEVLLEFEHLRKKEIIYLVGNVPIISPEEISEVNILEIIKGVEVEFKNIKPSDFEDCIISIDLDGTLTSKSNHHTLRELSRKKAVENYLGKDIDIEEYMNYWKELEDPYLKNILKIEGYSIYDKESCVDPEIKEKIACLSERNDLVLFTVTSRKRAKKFLEKENLMKFFTKIYSAKDDFNIPMKMEFMFNGIKKEFPSSKRFVHIGDLYELDYLESKKTGFEPIMVNNSDLRKISLERLTQKLN